MIIYQNIYVKIEFIKEYDLIKQVFLTETANMTEDEFKETQLALLDCIMEKKPNIILSNLRDLRLAISVGMQEWLIKNIFNEGEKVGVKKVAHLLSSDFMVQLSAEMTIDDYKDNIFENRFFDKEEKAMAWLLAK